jgi:hypothetical protein
MPRLAWTAFALAALIGGALVVADRAGAGEEPPAKPPAPPSMPTPQKAIDHALVKSLAGTWSVLQKSPLGESKGTTTFALGVGGTALIQDYEVAMGPMGSFHGHGVFKVSDDGKKLALWWLDTHTAAPAHYSGSLTESGYDLKSDAGVRLTLAKKDAALEFRLEMANGMSFTDTYTRK